MKYYDALWYIYDKSVCGHFAFLSLLWYIMVYYDELWYIMRYYCCIMMYYDVLWCIMIYYVLWYIMIYYVDGANDRFNR